MYENPTLSPLTREKLHGKIHFKTERLRDLYYVRGGEGEGESYVGMSSLWRQGCDRSDI